MSDLVEEQRLAALRELDVLGTAPSESFDRITRLAARMFGLPLAAVSLTDIDRQWFKSHYGTGLSSVPRRDAPCAEVVERGVPVVIPDLLADSRYRESYLAGIGVRFYAGAPLRTPAGFGVGSMCVMGMQPRLASEDELASLTDLAAMVMAQIELMHYLSRIDPLTRMPNRAQFIDDLENLEKTQLHRKSHFVALVELAAPEQITRILRVMGPSYLDGMIIAAARWIKELAGQERTVYHVAPTHFAVLSPADMDEREYAALIKGNIARSRGDMRCPFVATLVVGVAPFVSGETEPQNALRTALGAAQDAHGSDSRISFYSKAQDAASQRRYAILDAFAAALEAPDQLRLVYQPRIDPASGRCVGAEALLRWTHPTMGEVSPGEFMPLVEQTAMARATTDRVLDMALRQLAIWRRAEIDIRLSVNISGTNLLEPDLAVRVARALDRYTIQPEVLELEMTESAFVQRTGAAIELLKEIVASGVVLAIDDFGSGYSSLSYLERLPARVVKLDQSFMNDLDVDDRKRSLVLNTILLCQDLGYSVVAEGVETLEVLQFIRESGCDEAQGYLFARPMDVNSFSDWYGRQKQSLQDFDAVAGALTVV